MKLNHVHIKVSNIEISREFYLSLGFKIRERVGPFLFLHLGDEHHSLALQEIHDAEKQGENSIGLYHFSLEVENEQEFGAMINNLKQNNIPYSPIDHQISKVVYFSDPDNNGIEIMLDTRKSKQQLWKGKNLLLDI